MINVKRDYDAQRPASAALRGGASLRADNRKIRWSTGLYDVYTLLSKIGFWMNYLDKTLEKEPPCEAWFSRQAKTFTARNKEVALWYDMQVCSVN